MRLGPTSPSSSPARMVADAYGTTGGVRAPPPPLRGQPPLPRPSSKRPGCGARGSSADGVLVEFVELPGHPFWVGTQAHPEFKSRPDRPHPLFRELLARRPAPRRGAPAPPHRPSTPTSVPPPEQLTRHRAGSGAGFRHLGDEVRFEGWRISLVRAAFEAPDGTRFTRDVVRHPGAVAVVPVTDARHRPARAPVPGAGRPRAARDPRRHPRRRGRSPRDARRGASSRKRSACAAGTVRAASAPCSTAPASATRRRFSTWPGTSSPSPPPATARRSGTSRWWRSPLADVDAMVASGELVDAQTMLGLLLARRTCRARRDGRPRPGPHG